MNINQLKVFIHEYLEDFQGLIYDDDDNTELRKALSKLGYTLELVEQFGGEGMGEEYWVVFALKGNGHTKYYKLDGYYASFEGASFPDYLDFYEVHQVDVVVKQWKPKR